MHTKQIMADLQVLAFLSLLGSVLLCAGLAIAGFLFGRKRLGRWTETSQRWVFRGWGLGGKAVLAALLILAFYSAALLGISITSHEWTLAIGQEKYFCELDCHLAYSVTDVMQSKTLGAGQDAAIADGTFYVVTIRTRFDASTISLQRGNAPLGPGPRRMTLVDTKGRVYEPSAAGDGALEESEEAGTPITAALQPGDSYQTRIAFDLPADAVAPRLLLESPSQPSWISWFVIGDENSLLHKKVYLALHA